MALPFLFAKGNRQEGFACFLHKSLDQGEDVLEMTVRRMSTCP